MKHTISSIKRSGCKLQEKNGFTFIGVVISVLIVSIGVMAIFGLSNSSLANVDLAGKRLVASGLAQEGIEIIRDIRFSNVEWDRWEWFSASRSVGSTVDYCVQHDTIALFACPSQEVPLKLNTSTMLYQYDSGTNSPFYRRVTVKKESNENLKVSVEVKWRSPDGASWRYFIAEDRLWNWK